MQTPKDSARFYAIIKWTGIILNVASSVVLGYYEWKFENDLYFAFTVQRSIPQVDVTVVEILEFILAGLMLISCLFLADALRRFKQQTNIYKNIVLNHKLMYVHISVVLLQVFVTDVVASLSLFVYDRVEIFNSIMIFYSFSVFSI